KPIHLGTGDGHVLAVAEFVFVGDSVHYAVHLVDVRADHHCFALDAGVNFRDDHDVRIDAASLFANLSHEVSHGFDTEVDPLAEIRVVGVAKLQVFLGVETGLFAECGDGRVVKAGPRLLPAFEVRHPVRDVHVDTVDSCSGDLPHAFHVQL